MASKRWQDIGALAGLTLLVVITAGLGSAFTSQGTMGWYDTLVKPTWTPPSWVFGPVWTILYIMIILSGWLVVLRRQEKKIVFPLVIYAVQLALNAGWSILFFGFKRPDLAMIEIVALLLVIILNIIVFWRVSRWAALLLAPYLLWTGFATMLNFALWRLNS